MDNYLSNQYDNDSFVIPQRAITQLLTDKALSSGAIRVYLYLASSYKNKSKINNEIILKALNIAQPQTLANYFKQLIGSSWLKRTKRVGQNGKFLGGYDYKLLDKSDIGKIHNMDNTVSGIIDNNSIIEVSKDIANGLIKELEKLGYHSRGNPISTWVKPICLLLEYDNIDRFDIELCIKYWLAIDYKKINTGLKLRKTAKSMIESSNQELIEVNND